MVVRFAEDHLVIPPGTLRQFLRDCGADNPYTFTMDEFLDHFFRRFDEEHNSALFAQGLVDEASFSDDALMPLIEQALRGALPLDARRHHRQHL